jgi:hypothetical protein
LPSPQQGSSPSYTKQCDEIGDLSHDGRKKIERREFRSSAAQVEWGEKREERNGMN